MSEPLLSVVVIGRNEGARLRRCLESVAGMERRGFRVEMIYVDSASTDDSAAVAESLGAETIVLHPARPTAALGRNAGWRAAHGEWVLFLDGDTVLDRRFVAESLAEFGDPAVAVVWGHRRETLQAPSLYNRVLDLDWIYPPGDTAFCGGDALFLRSVLEATGGYDDTLIAGEEPELCRRITALGMRIVHVDRPMTGHDLAITRFSQYWKRATRAGHAFAEVSSRFAGTDNPFWSAESKNNLRRAVVLSTLLLGAPLVSVLSGRGWPAGLAALAVAALALRTAWKARWKSADTELLLLYGIHSHLQQIPIFAGQVHFWINRRRGLRAGLVEYKRS
jgi:glycosyltransferase involved in cell wall biosynthesis